MLSGVMIKSYFDKLIKAYFDKLIKADGLDNRLKVEIVNAAIPRTIIEFHLDNYYHYASALWLDEMYYVKDPYEYLSAMYEEAKRHLFLYLKEDVFAV